MGNTASLCWGGGHEGESAPDRLPEPTTGQHAPSGANIVKSALSGAAGTITDSTGECQVVRSVPNGGTLPVQHSSSALASVSGPAAKVEDAPQPAVQPGDLHGCSMATAAVLLSDPATAAELAEAHAANGGGVQASSPSGVKQEARQQQLREAAARREELNLMYLLNTNTDADTVGGDQCSTGPPVELITALTDVDIPPARLAKECAALMYANVTPGGPAAFLPTMHAALDSNCSGLDLNNSHGQGGHHHLTISATDFHLLGQSTGGGPSRQGLGSRVGAARQSSSSTNNNHSTMRGSNVLSHTSIPSISLVRSGSTAVNAHSSLLLSSNTKGGGGGGGAHGHAHAHGSSECYGRDHLILEAMLATTAARALGGARSRGRGPSAHTAQLVGPQSQV